MPKHNGFYLFVYVSYVKAKWHSKRSSWQENYDQNNDARYQSDIAGKTIQLRDTQFTDIYW